MDSVVDSIVKKCFPCQIAIPKPSHETLKMTRLPCSPWHQVSVDFCEVAGLYVLVVRHDYPRFPDIEIVHSTAANAVIPKLDRIFAAYGVPEVVKTDNGPSFNEHEFAQLADYLGFVFRKVTPLMARGKWRSWKVHEVFWKGTSHHYKLEAINVSVSPQLSCHPSP